MKFQTIVKTNYHAQYGAVTSRRTSEETLELWEKVKKLPIDQYLLVDPEKGEDISKVRQSLYGKLSKLAAQANFRVLFVINRSEKHLLIYKEPRK